MKLISNKYKTFIINRLAEISGLIFLSFSILLFFILFSYSPLDPSINNVTDQEAQNILGTIGANIADLLMQIFGSTSYLLLIIFLAWSYRLIKFKKLPFFVINLFCSLICLFIIDILFLIYETNIIHGFISQEVFINFIEPLSLSSSFYIESIFFLILIFLFLIFFIIACALDFDDWKKLFLNAWNASKLILRNTFNFIKLFSLKKKKLEINTQDDNDFSKEKIEPKIDFNSIKDENVSDYLNNNEISSEIVQKKMEFKEDINYVPPIIDILSTPKVSASSLVSKEEMDNNAIKLKEILS
jgi:hypothetical protein